MNKIDKAGNSKQIERDKSIEMQNNKKIKRNKALTSKMNEEISQMEEYEDTTKYGEFVSSYFAWLTLEKQKQNVKRMEEMTDK